MNAKQKHSFLRTVSSHAVAIIVVAFRLITTDALPRMVPGYIRDRGGGRGKAIYWLWIVACRGDGWSRPWRPVQRVAKNLIAYQIFSAGGGGR
jgi:hypothetical protein